MAEVAVTSRLTGHAGSGTALRPVEVGRLALCLGDLETRYLCLDGIEFVRRLFVAVRDPEWGTAPTLAEDTAVDLADDLRASMTALTTAPEKAIELRWKAALRCEPDGATELTFTGTALRPFRYARIGICILHPTTFAGGSYAAKTPDGWIEGILTDAIAPQLPGEHGFGEPLFPAFDELVLTSPDGLQVQHQLAGDLFEFEDQRNWADASYKTYSTPLSLGPQIAAPGQAFEQRVLITPRIARRNRAAVAAAVPSVEIGTDAAGLVPPLGLVLGSNELGPSAKEPLRRLQPAHIRGDVRLGEEDWRHDLRHAAAIAAELNAPLELALTLGAGDESLRELGAILDELRPALARALVFRAGEPVTTPEDAAAVRSLFEQATTPVSIYGGTDQLFADLNARRPQTEGLDGFAFPVVPTIHADDDLSLVETMPVFADIIRTARTFGGQMPLAVTPVTLRERPQTDDRQASLLAAVWALGTIAALASESAESVTVFEAAGAGGILDTTGSTYPVYHVLAELCRWRGRHIVASSVSDPLVLCCLAVASPDGAVEALLANVLPRPNRARLYGLPAERLQCCRLNEATTAMEGLDTAPLRRQPEPLHSPEIELGPYEIVRLEAVG